MPRSTFTPASNLFFSRSSKPPSFFIPASAPSRILPEPFSSAPKNAVLIFFLMLFKAPVSPLAVGASLLPPSSPPPPSLSPSSKKSCGFFLESGCFSMYFLWRFLAPSSVLALSPATKIGRIFARSSGFS